MPYTSICKYAAFLGESRCWIYSNLVILSMRGIVFQLDSRLCVQRALICRDEVQAWGMLGSGNNWIASFILAREQLSDVFWK